MEKDPNILFLFAILGMNYSFWIKEIGSELFANKINIKKLMQPCLG